MPLTNKGNEILHSLQKEYGEKHGESVLYALKNSGKITGIDEKGKRDEMNEGSEGLKTYGDDVNWKDDSHHHEFAGKTGPEIEDKRKSHDDDDDKRRDAGMGLVHAKEEPHASEANYPKPMDSLDAMEARNFPNDPFGDKNPQGGFEWEKVMSPSQMKSGPLNIFRE